MPRGTESATSARAACSPLVRRHPNAPRLPSACCKFFAPGIGIVSWQIHQLIATCIKQKYRLGVQSHYTYTLLCTIHAGLIGPKHACKLPAPARGKLPNQQAITCCAKQPNVQTASNTRAHYPQSMTQLKKQICMQLTCVSHGCQQRDCTGCFFMQCKSQGGVIWSSMPYWAHN